MTDKSEQHRQEYIITDEQLKKYEGLFFLDDDAQEDFKEIRSRPTHSSIPAPAPTDEHDAQVASEAREQVLRAIEGIIVMYGTARCGERIDDYITKSLRSKP